MTWLLQNELQSHQVGLDHINDRAIFAVTPNTLRDLVNRLFENQTRPTPQDSKHDSGTAENYHDAHHDARFDYWATLNPRQRSKYLNAAQSVNEMLSQALRQAIVTD